MSEPELIYIAIGPHIWAKGFTREQALATLREENGRKRVKEWLLYTCTDPWAYVDAMGGIVRGIDAKLECVETHGVKAVPAIVNERIAPPVTGDEL